MIDSIGYARIMAEIFRIMYGRRRPTLSDSQPSSGMEINPGWS
jgi:hypothetical protein